VSSETAITLQAPAKINLALEVVGRRESGYHAIRSVMLRLPRLADVVRVRVGDGDGVRIHADAAQVPVDESNICHRAASGYLARIRRSASVDIDIEKRIPVAAGLGGGSSDAAAVLLALNRHFGDAIEAEPLASLGANIGMDVPFFLAGQPAALATGMGEIVRGAPAPARLYVLLVNPKIAIPTQHAYAMLGRNLWFMSHRQRADHSRTMLRALASGGVDGIAAALYNDFETVMLPLHPVVNEIRQALRALGARGALMSGSGSTVFGLFASPRALAAAEAALREHYPSFVVARG